MILQRVGSQTQQGPAQSPRFDLGGASISADGRWLIDLPPVTPQVVVPAVDVKRYDLRQAQPPTLLQAGVLPAQNMFGFVRADVPLGDPVIWSPDSRYFALFIQDHTGGMEDRPILYTVTIFRVADGKVLGSATLPGSPGSLRLTNDLRLLAVTYQGAQAALYVHSVPQHQWYQPIPLGTGTPIIVWAP
jgi:hypothetical protein